MNKYTYLLLNIFTLSYPIAQSFEHRLKYYKQWKRLFPAILITGVFFIVWDVLFTELGVWTFNKSYLIGYNIINLPIEEWMFFLTVPFASVFIYEVLNYYVKKDYIGKYAKYISLVLGVALILIVLSNSDKLYTFITFSITGMFLIIHSLFLKRDYLGRFFLAYLVTLIPFALVNGFLTSLPVVIYNNLENMGIRIGTIPIEDSIYNLLLFLMNITIYEALKKNQKAR